MYFYIRMYIFDPPLLARNWLLFCGFGFSIEMYSLFYRASHHIKFFVQMIVI